MNAMKLKLLAIGALLSCLGLLVTACDPKPWEVPGTQEYCERSLDMNANKPSCPCRPYVFVADRRNEFSGHPEHECTVIMDNQSQTAARFEDEKRFVVVDCKCRGGGK